MTDNAIEKTEKSFSILGQTFVFPGVGRLVVMTAALAGVMLLLRMMGLTVSLPGFAFGCGVMWLLMAGLDFRRWKAWALLLAWAVIVFTLSLATGAVVA